MPEPMVCGSSIMCVRRIRKTERWSASTRSSRLQTSRPAFALRVGQHLAGEPGHLDDLRLRGDRTRLEEPLRGLRDVDGVIAHPLEIIRDLEGGDDHPEVAGHRLLEREQVDPLFLDLHLHVVDHVVAGDDLVRLAAVTLEQRVHGQAERGFGLARHGEEEDLEVAQLLVEVPVQVAGHPNLPVM